MQEASQANEAISNRFGICGKKENDINKIIKTEIYVDLNANSNGKVSLKVDINEVSKESFLDKSKCKSFGAFTNEIKCFKCNEFKKGGPYGHSCIVGFRCEVCGKVFPAKSKRERHMSSHFKCKKIDRKDMTIFCNDCNKPIKKNNYRRHMQIHERVGPVLGKILKSRIRKSYVCGICNKDCVRKARFIKHQRYHENLKRNPCNECEESFKHHVELVRHISKVHRQVKVGTQCPICKDTFLTINNHLKTHQPNSRRCQKCHVVLTDHYSFKKHMRLHKIFKSQDPKDLTLCTETSSTNYFQCQFCIERFLSFDQYSSHIKKHFHFVRYPCPICPEKSFHSVHKLVEHIGINHYYIPSSHAQCHICRKIMLGDLLKNHMKDHWQNSVECEPCDKLFGTKYEYKMHVKMFHKKITSKEKGLQKIITKYSTQKINFKTVSCFICHLTMRASHITSHLKFHQSFKCMLCKKIFFNRALLEKHEKKHLRLSQRCPICSSSFLSHIRLLSHLKKVHNMSFTVSKGCSRCIF